MRIGAILPESLTRYGRPNLRYLYGALRGHRKNSYVYENRELLSSAVLTSQSTKSYAFRKLGVNYPLSLSYLSSEKWTRVWKVSLISATRIYGAMTLTSQGFPRWKWSKQTQIFWRSRRLVIWWAAKRLKISHLSNWVTPQQFCIAGSCQGSTRSIQRTTSWFHSFSVKRKVIWYSWFNKYVNNALQPQDYPHCGTYFSDIGPHRMICLTLLTVIRYNKHLLRI